MGWEERCWEAQRRVAAALRPKPAGLIDPARGLILGSADDKISKHSSSILLFFNLLCVSLHACGGWLILGDGRGLPYVHFRAQVLMGVARPSETQGVGVGVLCSPSFHFFSYQSSDKEPELLQLLLPTEGSPCNIRDCLPEDILVGNSLQGPPSFPCVIIIVVTTAEALFRQAV